MDRCIVIQGPVNLAWIPLVKSGWQGYPTVYSVWRGEPHNPFDYRDNVIWNYDVPSGVRNLNKQRVSSINGFRQAKDMGFKRVLKWRTDFYCPNPKEFLETFDEDGINFYAYHRDGYITDFFMEGDIDEMIELFTFDGLAPYRYPEEAFTRRLYESGLDTKARFNCRKIFEHNDIKWLKPNYWLSANTLDNDYGDKIKYAL
jgi:hypothetical protein